MTVFCLFSLRPKAWRDLACSQILTSPLLGPPPPAGSMPILSSLGSRRCSPPASLHWAHLGGLSRHLTGSPGICRGALVTTGAGPSLPDELAALVTSHHHILFSPSTFPSEPPSGWEASGRTRYPTDHSRSWPGSGPCGLSEAESQQEAQRQGPFTCEDPCPCLWIRLQVAQALGIFLPTLPPNGACGALGFSKRIPVSSPTLQV